jgi:hypothetical protein
MPAITGETENGRSISDSKDRLAAKFELPERPGGGDAEDAVERNGDGRHRQRHPDGRLCVGIVQRLEIETDALARASTATVAIGSDDEHEQETDPADEDRRARPAWVAQGRTLAPSLAMMPSQPLLQELITIRSEKDTAARRRRSPMPRDNRIPPA